MNGFLPYLSTRGTIPLVTHAVKGAFCFLLANAVVIESAEYSVGQNALHYRTHVPAACVTTTADNGGRFAMKKCYRCKQVKPLSQFSPHHKRPGEIHNWCDECRAKPLGKAKTYQYSCHFCGRATTSYTPTRKTALVCFDCSRKRDRERERIRGGDTLIKKNLIKQRGERCERCGAKGRVIMHHIKEVSDGGESTPDNLILVCQKCHKELHPKGWGKRIYR